MFHIKSRCLKVWTDFFNVKAQMNKIDFVVKWVVQPRIIIYTNFDGLEYLSKDSRSSDIVLVLKYRHMLSHLQNLSWCLFICKWNTLKLV